MSCVRSADPRIPRLLSREIKPCGKRTGRHVGFATNPKGQPHRLAPRKVSPTTTTIAFSLPIRRCDQPIGIWLGNAWDQREEEAGWIFVQRGNAYGAVRPVLWDEQFEREQKVKTEGNQVYFNAPHDGPTVKLRTDGFSWSEDGTILLLQDAHSPVIIEAGRGWQASRIAVQADRTYNVTATGQWQTAKDAEPVDADGDDRGIGRLQAVIWSDYQLTRAVEVGAKATIKPARDGKLFFRCSDGWGRLHDNTGRITASVKLEPR